MTLETVKLDFLIPMGLVLNANQRLHYQAKAKRVKALRALGKEAASEVTLPSPCLMTAWFGFPDRRRRDLHNYYPTLKAVIDGIVDAGALVDDSHKYLTGPDLRLSDFRPEKGHLYLLTESTIFYDTQAQ